jgi:Thiolase, C-terminal domain
MNSYGCSLIFGHPQGPTGLRSVTELIEELRQRGGGTGLFTGCAATHPIPGRPKNLYVREDQILPRLAALAILLDSRDPARSCLFLRLQRHLCGQRP